MISAAAVQVLRLRSKPESGANVTIASKARIGYGNNTFISKASVSAALGRPDPRDNPEVHLQDAWIGGRFLNDRKVLEKIVRGIGSEIGFLKKCGVKFEEVAGERVITRAAGHRYPRNVRPPKQVGSEYTLPLTEYAAKAGPVR
jgi:aspartate oxidase